VVLADETIKIILTNKSNQTSIKTGETIDADIVFLPYDKLEKFKIENFNNKKIFDLFFVSNIKLFEVSVNNPDAFSIQAKLTLVAEPKEGESLYFTSGNVKVPVEMRNIQIEKSEIETVEKFILMDQKVNPIIPWKLYAFCFIFGGILIYFSVRKIKSIRRKRSILKNEKDNFNNQLNLWNEKFSNAKIRSDFEEIFLKKNDWKKFKKSENDKVDDFLKCVERHQYKPAWGESEYREINSYFLHIKSLFKD